MDDEVVALELVEVLLELDVVEVDGNVDVLLAVTVTWGKVPEGAP